MIQKLNDRSLFIDSVHVEEANYNKHSAKNINKLTLVGGQIILINSKITVDGEEFKVNYITNDRKNKRILLQQFKCNKTTEFLLPLLGYKRSQLLYNTSLLNAYSYFDIEGCDKGDLLLLYKYKETPSFEEMDGLFYKDPNVKIINNIYNNPKYVGYIFTFNFRDANKEKIKLMQGMYKDLTPLTKSTIVNFHAMTKDHSTRQALYNKNTYRQRLERKLNVVIDEKMSLIEKPSLMEETLRAELL